MKIFFLLYACVVLIEKLPNDKSYEYLSEQKKLGKKYLVCVGDEGNDVAMLQGADFAFCPSDGAVAADFPNVCPCSQGAVADVIYNEIPKILRG